jgi:glycosyltransferase involved in cell wall biosynthesis
MRVLFLSWWWPYPADNGSKIRIYNLLRNLASAHEVYLLSFADAGEATEERIAHLRTFCAQVEVVPRPFYNPGGLKAMAGYLSRWPRYLLDVYSDRMAERVQAFASSVDVIIASELQTVRYLDLAPSLPAVFEGAEVTGFEDVVAQATSPLQRFRTQLTLRKMRNTVRRLMERGIAISVVSQSEQDYLRELAPADARIAVIPNGVDTNANGPGQDTPTPNTLIYPGAVTYDANYDAVSYFIQDVLPLVQQQITDARFTVTGGTGNVDVRDLAAQPGVTFAGYLPDVAPAIRASWAVVVPLRLGGGTRLKILEAMALGVPVISTRKGAEGLDVRDGENILLADQSEALAQAVIHLLNDAALRTRIACNARTLVEREYDWQKIAGRLDDLIQQVAGKRQEEQVTL